MVLYCHEPGLHLAAHQVYPVTLLSYLEIQRRTPLEGQRHSTISWIGLQDRHPRIDLMHKDRAPKNQMVSNEEAMLKGEIRVTKLNSDIYQSWADGMELLLDRWTRRRNAMANCLWNGTLPGPTGQSIQSRNWIFDDDLAKAWIYSSFDRSIERF